MDNHFHGIPILGITAYSGTGKTTLLVKLIPLLNLQDLRIAVVKHAHHTFDIDYPGKDSYKIRSAGASQIVIGSNHRAALIVERDAPEEIELEELLNYLQPQDLDLIIVEGFKDAAIPKIELHRQALGNPLICKEDKTIIALASDANPPPPVGIPTLALNEPESIVKFICSQLSNGELVKVK